MPLDFRGWREAGRVYRHRGHAIFHRVDGDGEVLLAVHGFPSASWDWHLVWPELTRRFRVIAADMIGFGWSEKPRSYAYSISDQADLQEGLLKDLGVSRVHVLAHDYGDTVAQELLARAEAGGALRIASVVFLNGGLFPEAHHARRVQRLLASPLGPVVERFIRKRTFGGSMKAIFGPDTPPSEALIDELWTLLRHDDGHLVGHRLIRYLDERRKNRERWVGVLTKTRVPIRFVAGAADPISGPDMAARYRALVPDPDVVELPGVGHYPQLEAPDAVLAAIRAFHERVTPPGRSPP